MTKKTSENSSDVIGILVEHLRVAESVGVPAIGMSTDNLRLIHTETVRLVDENVQLREDLETANESWEYAENEIDALYDQLNARED